VVERMEPTSGVEPLTCRLRILAREGTPPNPKRFQLHDPTPQHVNAPHL
jgi:hypothetical protein